MCMTLKFAQKLSYRWRVRFITNLLFGVQEAERSAGKLGVMVKVVIKEFSNLFPKNNVCTLQRTCHAGEE